MIMINKQQENFNKKEKLYNNRIKPKKNYTTEEIVLNVLEENLNEWFYIWELMGSTKWGWLSHATHSELRRLEREEKIIKAYIGKYVVYTYKAKTTLF